VPFILSIDRAAKHSRPELALGGQVSGVEHNDLVVDFHRVMIALSADDDQFPDCRRYVARRRAPRFTDPTPQTADNVDEYGRPSGAAATNSSATTSVASRSAFV
jgi:hypothetical protein